MQSNIYHSELHELLHLIVDFPFSRKVKRFLHQGEGSVIASHSCYWGAQGKEAFLLKHCRDLSSHSAHTWSLVSDDAPSSFLDGVDQSLSIVGIDSLKVDNFARNSIMFRHLSYFFQCSHQVSISNKSNILAFAHNFRLLKREAVIAYRDYVFSISVECLWLEENDWVGVSNRSEEQTFSLNWISWNNYLESRSMRKVGLRRLRMIQRTVTNCTPSCPDCKRSAFELTTRTVSILCCLINNLIEGWEDIISELYLCDSGMSGNSQSDGESNNALLGKRSIENSIDSVALAQS